MLFTFAVLFSKFVQDTMYQLVSELAKFCRRCDKITFFLDTV